VLIMKLPYVGLTGWRAEMGSDMDVVMGSGRGERGAARSGESAPCQWPYGSGG
jgi:hypothetical protein